MMQSSHMMFSWTTHAEQVTSDKTPGDICQLHAHLALLSHIFKHSVLNSTFAANPSRVFTVIDAITYILRNLAVPGLTPELENYKGQCNVVS